MTLREIDSREAPLVEETERLPPPSLDRFRGCILGCALGDVVGAWAEGRPAEEAADYVEHFVAKLDFAKKGRQGLPFGAYTDDTQLTRELALSLIDEGDWVPEDFADRIARIFANDLVMGYGKATQEAAVRLLDGVPWDQAGTPPPRAGNGAAMRAAPIGLFFWDDAYALLKAATEQAIVTHAAPMAVAGAVAVAMATAMCLNADKMTSGPHELGWWAWLSRFLQRSNKEFARDVEGLSELVFKGRKKRRWQPGCAEEYAEALAFATGGDDKNWSGVSPWARSSVLWSLYCVAAYPTDVWKAIQTAVAAGGDTDTTAAMVGAMVGARVGLDQFPAQVVQSLGPQVTDVKAPEWGWEGLERLAEHLHAVVLRRHGEAPEAPQSLPRPPQQEEPAEAPDEASTSEEQPDLLALLGTDE